MPGRSRKTQVLRIRLPNEVMEVILRRVGKDWDTVSQYVREMVTYQVMRSHKPKRKIPRLKLNLLPSLHR